MRKILFLMMAVMLSSCQSDIDGDTYAVSETGQMSQVFKGVVISKREIQVMEDRESKGQGGVGTVAGAALGGVAGSGIGSGRGAIVGTIGGVVVGGVIGQQVDKRVGTQKGYEYIVELEEGRTIAVTQGLKPDMTVGQEVIVLYSDWRKGGYRARVIPR